MNNLSNVKKFVFYHISGTRFTKLKNRNMLGNPITVKHFKDKDYNNTVSLFIGLPTLKDIEKLRKAGFSNYGKVGDPLYIYEVDFSLYQNDVEYIHLTSTKEKYNFLKDNEHLSDEDFFFKRENYYRKINYKEEFKNLKEFVKIKYKYENFSQDVDYQIQEAKKDKKLYEYYAACIPHLMVSIKQPIPVKLIETNQSDNVSNEDLKESIESDEMVELEKNSVKNLKDMKLYKFDSRYVADNKGGVFLIKAITPRSIIAKAMRPFITRDGYVEYVLTIRGGVKKHIQAHRIVASLFLPLVKGANYVNHKDLNRTNNNVSNLEWTTQSENLYHSYKNNPFRKRNNQYTVNRV